MSWSDLKEAEVSRILREFGDSAFRDIRAESGDLTAPGRLLKRMVRDGKPVNELTNEAEKTLKIHKGLGTGFRYFDPGTGEEYFLRLIQVRTGYLEVGFSWFGFAGPFIEDWRQSIRNQCDSLALQNSQKSLFADLDRDRQQKVKRLLCRMQAIENGRKIMEVALGQVSRQSQNPVRIPAIAFRVLLDLETNSNWKQHVEAALQALRAFNFRINSYDMQPIRGYGSFLGSWMYQGAGSGAHGDGQYLLWVQPAFLGCLSIFESGKRQLSSGLEITSYQFVKKHSVPIDKRSAHDRLGNNRPAKGANGSFSGFDAGAVFYNAAEKFSPERQILISFLEREITLKRDPHSIKLGDSAIRQAERVKHPDPDANKPRIYRRDFCHLLPAGAGYCAALGHFRNNPESGRTLYGRKQGRKFNRGGTHWSGLISEMGYQLPSGAAHQKRQRIVRLALEDLKAVVVEYLKGVVAVMLPGRNWLTLEQSAALPEDELCRQARFYLFIPEKWSSDRIARWESRMEERARNGQGRYAWKATEDPRGSESGSDDESGMPLNFRFRIARIERGLSLSDVAKIFGVTKQAVSSWEIGPSPDMDGKPHGKPIPASLIPFIEEWIRNRQSPSPKQLNGRRNARAKRLEIKDQASTSRSAKYLCRQPPARQKGGSVNLPLTGFT